MATFRLPFESFLLACSILADDDRGVGEPLSEPGLDGKGLIIRGTHRVMLSPNATAGVDLRRAAADSLFPLGLRYASNTPYNPAAKNSFSALTSALPANLHVVTVHAQGLDVILLRVAHMFAVGEDASLSSPVSVDLSTLFAGFKIVSATEMTLPGTIPLTEAPVTTYMTTDGQSTTLPVIPPAPSGPGLTVTLTAMQIRTFRCQIAR